MSLQFNDTTLKNGLAQEIDSICTSDVTAYPLADKARRLNNALDDYFQLVLDVDKPMQIDDSNLTDLPISTFDLVSGQRSYNIGNDATGNEILKVHKVYIKNSSTGLFVELRQTDLQERAASDTFLDNSIQPQGVPNKYDWFAGSLFLDPIPNYASAGGAKIIYQRTGSYFVAGDTTKKAGIPGVHHVYLARKASLPYLIEKGKAWASSIKVLIAEDEQKIINYYTGQSADAGNAKITTAYTNSR